MTQIRVRVSTTPLDAKCVTSFINRIIVVDFNQGDNLLELARQKVLTAGEKIVEQAMPVMAVPFDQFDWNEKLQRSETFTKAFPPDFSKVTDYPAWSTLMHDQPICGVP